VLDLCKQHAETQDDRQCLEQFRAYITMMRARALASQALQDNEPKRRFTRSTRGWMRSRSTSRRLDRNRPMSSRRGAGAAGNARRPGAQAAGQSENRSSKKRLQAALLAENYELAAILRDELKNLDD